MMRRLRSAVPCSALLLAACGPGGFPTNGPTDPARMHRLYDFTPVSPENRLLVRIADTPVAFPVSEYRAYLRSPEVPDSERVNLSFEAKKRHLGALINEHLMLWEAYRQGGDRGAAAKESMAENRRSVIAALLLDEEVEKKGQTTEERERLKAALVDGLFEKAGVAIVPEAHAQLRQLPRTLKQKGVVESALHPRLQVTLATFGDTTVTVGNIWERYIYKLDHGKSADVETEKGVLRLVKEHLETALLTAESERRGLDKTPAYDAQLQENRAALARMWMQGRVRQEVDQQMRSGADLRIRQWYDQNQRLYMLTKDDGTSAVQPFEQAQERARNDFSDALYQHLWRQKAESLKGDRKVEIDEALLGSE
jgi:hypothetical protein